MPAHHPGAPPGEKERPAGGGAQTKELGRLKTKHSIGTPLPLLANWQIVMLRAYAIRHYRGREKSHAVCLWRAAVQDALGQEVRR